MKAFVVSLMLSLIGLQSAMAADLPIPAAAPTDSYYPWRQPVNWGGVYVGVNGGYAAGTSNWSNAGVTTGNFAVPGPLAGATIGINYAGIGNWVLLGLEGDVDWSGVQGNSPAAGCANVLSGAVVALTPGTTCRTVNTWLSTFRLRAGYTYSNILFFVTAGGATGDTRIGISSSGRLFEPTPQLGWTAGAGLEYAFNDSISAKIEYLYVNLGAIACPQGTTCGSVDNTLSGTNASVTFTENLVRVGVNYKFSW